MIKTKIDTSRGLFSILSNLTFESNDGMWTEFQLDVDEAKHIVSRLKKFIESEGG